MLRHTLAALFEVLGIATAALSVQVPALPREIAWTPASSTLSAGLIVSPGQDDDDHEAELEWLPRPPGRFDAIEVLPVLPGFRGVDRPFVFEEP